jgi:hypothetical protein
MRTQHGGQDLIKLKLYLQNQEYNRKKFEEESHQLSMIILTAGAIILLMLVSQGGWRVIWQ